MRGIAGLLAHPKLWPDYALVWDTETTLDLEQKLNFGVWRFCQLQMACTLPSKREFSIAMNFRLKTFNQSFYTKKYLADGLVRGADQDLVVLSRAEFVERVFWESVRAGALIVGFNLPFDISRIAVRGQLRVMAGFLLFSASSVRSTSTMFIARASVSLL